MTAWWSGLGLFERVLWYIAVPATALFLIQAVMTFTGLGGAEGDADGDAAGDGGEESGDGDGSAFRIFTVRNLIIFFAVFGWCGITLYNSGAGELVTVLVSILLGITIMILVAGLFYAITRLTQSGTMNPRNALGQYGEVYIPIPAHRSGAGKIQITLQGAMREMDAVTEGKMLPRGTVVKVVDVLNNNVLLVQK